MFIIAVIYIHKRGIIRYYQASSIVIIFNRLVIKKKKLYVLYRSVRHLFTLFIFPPGWNFSPEGKI